MQQDKTKIALLRWHSSTRYRNGSKLLDKTSPWSKHPPLSTTYCFLFTCLDCGNKNQRGLHLKFTSTVTLFQNESEKRGVCVCLSAGCSFHCLGSCCEGKMLTINTWGNLVIFPLVGRQPVDPNLKQMEQWSDLCPGWHQLIIWRGKSSGRERELWR